MNHVNKGIAALAQAISELANQHLSQNTTQEANAVVVQAVGSAIAFALPLPNEPVTGDGSVEAYYNNFYRARVSRLVNDINEETLIDTSTIARIAVQLWIFRYRIVFDPRSLAGLIHTLAQADGVFPDFVSDGLRSVFSKSGRDTAAIANATDNIATIMSQTLVGEDN